MEPIDPVPEKLFPASVRKAVNRCVSRLNRLWRVQYEDTPSAKVLETEGDITLVLPRALAGTSARTRNIGFGWRQSPYTGSGTAPINQGLKIKLYGSVINEIVVPDNMASEFTLTNGAAEYIILTTNQNAIGIVTSATLSVDASLTPDPAGTVDAAPATSSRPLWKFTTNGYQITEAVELRTGGIDVAAVPYDMDCGSITLRMYWGRALASP